MAELKGTQVAAIVVPFTDADKYATHDAEYGKGGFRSVETIALRNAIPTERKTKGMVVRVNETGLHYYWNGSAWTEWLPKGTMLVDAMFDINSTNPVQNKVITTRINEHAAKFDDIYSKIENIPTITIDTALSTTSTNPVQNKVIASHINTINDNIKLIGNTVSSIPIITVDTVWNATSDNPASSKAIESTISHIRTTANSANTKANSALATANAAIPKSYIDTAFDDNALDTRVPSTKLLHTTATNISIAIQSVQDRAVQAYDIANAAIPKSKIDTSIDGTETAHDAVPSVGAVVTYVKSQRTAIDGSINAVSGRVTTLETWKNGIGNKNQANGVAGLDASGKISASQLPAGYDNVDKLVAFVTTNPSSGMTIGQKWYNTTTKKIFTATSATSGSVSDPIGNDMIYIDQNANKSYYWTGTDMVNIGSGNALALGTTSSTAFRGDYGNTLYTNFGSGTNLTGTQAARDFFHNMSLFNSLANTSILKNLVVQPEANFVRLQNDIVYLIGEVNTGDGYDIPAATTTKAGVMTADMYKTLQEIELATFPLNLALAGGGTWEMGSSTKPVVSITATRKGSDVTSSCSIVVQPQPSLAGSLSSDKRTWTASTNISNVYNIKVSATLNTQSITKSVIYYFKYKKYYGTSSNATLTNAQILALGGSTWADSRSMGATNFDCTGGKYPYYVIPADIYTGLEVWVGGLKNSDITVTDITLTNASGSSKAYKVVRLTNIQTGILSIQFK